MTEFQEGPSLKWIATGLVACFDSQFTFLAHDRFSIAGHFGP